MKLFICLLCFATLPLFAETIGDVEYHLPSKITESWEMGNKIQTSNGTTVVYVPKNVDLEERKEFFGLNSNKKVMDLKDIEALKKLLSKNFPHNQMEIDVLSKSPSSILLEWSAKEKDVEKVHGWTRIFNTKTGTVFLTYQTENVTDVSDARALWLPVLKEATLK